MKESPGESNDLNGTMNANKLKRTLHDKTILIEIDHG